MQRHLASVAREERRARREPAAGAGTADHDAGLVDTVLVTARCEPSQAGVAVVDVRGVLMLGREAVLHRRDEAPEVACPRLAHEVVTVECAEHHAATVDPEERSSAFATVVALVDPHSHVRVPVLARHHVVSDPHFGNRWQRGAQRCLVSLDQKAELRDVATEVDLG